MPAYPEGSREAYLLRRPDTNDTAIRLKMEAFERLGLVRREYDLHDTGRDTGLFGTTPGRRSTGIFGESGEKEPEITYDFEFTEYGIQFIQACVGPKEPLGRVVPGQPIQ